MKQRRGMTLLEVAVALTVAAMALIAGASTLGFLVDQQSRSEVQALSSAHAARTALRDWMAEARLTTEGDAEFRGDSARVSFVTSAPTPVSTKGTIVRLLARNDGVIVEMTPWRRETGQPVTLRIAGAGSRLSVRYLASIEGERQWQRDWTSTSVLPAAVEIRMSSEDVLHAVPMTIALASRR